MAFWGVEVRPGKPFIHAPNNGRRLHISQATLGTGSSTKNSVVQCNVGNSSPVFLCSLFPEKTEISQLHLEFEETVEVVFSVIGPRSVHLTGYYLGGGCGQHFHPDDETESYGEDIADTETERSANGSVEDEYEDSFINDDEDPEIMSPSTVYSSEEIFDKKKRKHGKGSHKRLRKKFQFIESDDEDKMPISFLHEKESASMGSEAAKKCEKEKGETSEKKVKDNGNWVSVSKGNAGAVLGVSKRQINDHHSFLPLSDMGSRNGAKPKKKRGKNYKEEVPLEDDFFFCRALGQQKSIQSEVEADKLDLDFITTEDQKTTNDKHVEKLKRRKKKYAQEKESPDGDNQLSYEHKAQPDEAEAKNTLQDMLVTNKENQKERNGEVKNTLQDMLVTDEGNRKDTNDEEDKVQDEAKAENTGQDMLLVKKENQKQTDDDRAVLPWNPNLPPTQLDPESVTKPKKKRKRANKKVLDAIKEHEGKEDDFKTDSHDHELSVQDEHENGAKPERKRKERADKKFPQTCGDSHNNAIKEEEGKQDEDKSTSLDPVVSVQEEQNQKQQSFVTLNADQSAEESQSKKKMKRKRRNEENKESRTRESMEASNGFNA
ncbi:PEPTIDYL-PROLYL CIS-TRANS ISOMERASE FKBP53-LIKE [Salix viminalis]|uniref:peptidylprolyl isomerase n=1 Tax=Salix viminalis TaxID=40686 RepID=A0A9Q0SJ32_SALVM|nr:PEPTIDYL-PROLYL CIS-TRANS ISOMERASE FKBP53-LIKE [Salix viminalis]